ncbi:hypothetical protein V6N11_008411 [Hibiscus sabdariffa]|uniref:Uncharacterized protein n=1 Tax=Hibiscus sabdariffa TaxID=183260 RepID=A0ABR2P8R3_9ROSI
MFYVFSRNRSMEPDLGLGSPIMGYKFMYGELLAAQKEIQDGYSRSHKEGNTNDKLNSMNKKEIHKQNGNDWATMKHRNRSLMLTVSAEAGTAKTVKGIRSLLLHRLQRGVLQGCLHCSAWPLTAASSGSLGRSIFSAHSVSVQVYRGAENVDWVGKLCEKINELE